MGIPGTQGLFLRLFGTKETRGEERGLRTALRPLFLSDLDVDHWPGATAADVPQEEDESRVLIFLVGEQGHPDRMGGHWVSGSPGDCTS